MPNADVLFSPAQLKKNSFWGAARSVSASILFAVSYPVYIRFLSLEIFGVWIICTALVFYLQLGALNLPQAVAKLISESLSKKDAREIAHLAASVIGGVLVSGVVIFGLTVLLRDIPAAWINVSDSLKSYLPLYITLAAVIAILVMLAETLGGILSGIGRMDRIFQLEILRMVITFLISILLLLKQANLMALFQAHILGYLLYVGIITFHIVKQIGRSPFTFAYLSWHHLKVLVQFAIPLVGGSILSTLIQPFNRLFLGVMISPAAAGIYDIADRSSQIARAPVEAALRPIMPQISGMHTLNDFEQIKILTLKWIKMIILFTTPVFILLFGISDFGVKIWLGKFGYKEISTNFRIILWGNYLNMLSIPIYYALMGMGQVKTIFKAHFLQTSINLILVVIGLYFLRNVWIVSLSLIIALAIASLYQICIYFNTRDTLRYIVKGVKLLFVPVLIFMPSLIFRNDIYLFIIYSLLAASIYALFLFSRPLFNYRSKLDTWRYRSKIF